MGSRAGGRITSTVHFDHQSVIPPRHMGYAGQTKERPFFAYSHNFLRALRSYSSPAHSIQLSLFCCFYSIVKILVVMKQNCNPIDINSLIAIIKQTDFRSLMSNVISYQNGTGIHVALAWIFSFCLFYRNCHSSKLSALQQAA